MRRFFNGPLLSRSVGSSVFVARLRSKPSGHVAQLATKAVGTRRITKPKDEQAEPAREGAKVVEGASRKAIANARMGYERMLRSTAEAIWVKITGQFKRKTVEYEFRLSKASKRDEGVFQINVSLGSHRQSYAFLAEMAQQLNMPLHTPSIPGKYKLRMKADKGTLTGITAEKLRNAGFTLEVIEEPQWFTQDKLKQQQQQK